MRDLYGQTPIDISGTSFPRVVDADGKPRERFWYVLEEFIKHSRALLSDGRMFSCISARLVNDRWVCSGKPISTADIAAFVWKMRLFYMESESMSIYSVCRHMETHIANASVQLFFRHMRESWEEHLKADALLIGDYSGAIKTNKQLIDAVLYSGNFHSQEKHKRRYEELLRYMDESLILMSAYNAMHGSYQMTQISRSLSELREDNPVVLLPNHLRHEWDENYPYKVIRSSG